MVILVVIVSLIVLLLVAAGVHDLRTRRKRPVSPWTTDELIEHRRDVRAANGVNFRVRDFDWMAVRRRKPR
ncbi:hypothetical protein GCM10017786_57340 [Amycolatopsis deserti]|uniref:Secreted protein n=1 Tax=Amycolatopsis deserti TaxID=185696 RepID=A0ABQ3JAJ1_9PSEU|nr:hypothetical protein [Amycolatopsis deserti]GHF16008.1 hypothetical protein GCM10017786_57340 [Amycolatopsis deserti]